MRLPPPLTTIPMTIPARLMLMPEINNGNNDGSSVAPELSPNSDNNESTSTTNVNNGSHAITTPQLLSHQHQSPQPTAQTFLGNP